MGWALVWAFIFDLILFIERKRFIYVKEVNYLYKKMVYQVKKRAKVARKEFKTEKSKLIIYAIGAILLLACVLIIVNEVKITGKTLLSKSECFSGMISYWMFDESSGTNAEDSFDSHNGTLINGPSWTTGKVDGGLFFDGVNDYVQTQSNELKTADDFTISLWFKAGKTDFAHHLIWQGKNTCNGWATCSDGEMHISLGDYHSSSPTYINNTLSFFIGDSASSSDTLRVAVSFSDKSNWHHVVAVLSDVNSAPEVELYLDGVLVDSDSVANPALMGRGDWNANLTIGKPGTSARYFNGSMDEVAIFDRALSESEVKELYDKSRFGWDNYCSIFRGSSTINTYYNSNTDILTVSGEAPKAATQASLTISKTSGSGTPYSDDSAVAPSGTNENAYSFDVDVSSFDASSYNIEVAFFDSSDNEIEGYGVSSIFNDLLVAEFDEDLTDLEQNVSDIFDYLASLNVSGGADCSENISFLINQTIILQGELDDLSDRVDELNESLYALTLRVDGIDSTLVYLESWLTDLSSRVNAMDHGTINLYYLGPGPVPILRNRLFVSGEAPVGAVSAKILLYDTTFTWGDLFSGNPPVMSNIVPVFTALPSNQNLYFGSIATSSLEPIKYNVVVRFYDSSSDLMTGYDVSALFDNLIILDIAERLDEIEEDLYGDARNELMNAIRADYCAWKVASGENFGPAYTPYCTGNLMMRAWNWRNMLQDYGYEDTLYWTMQNFYRDSSQLWSEIDDVWGDLNIMFKAAYYGFHDIVFTSRVETYYNPSVTVPITYTIRSNVTIPSAKIGIRDVSAGFSQVLRTTYIGADKTYRFTDYVTFSQTGTYNMQLALFKTTPGLTIYQSTNFVVDVVDIAELVPDSTIELVLPNNWGNNFSNPPNPPNDDISWHQSGLINMRAVLGANTPLSDESCEVYYHSNRNPTLGRMLLPGLTINKTINVCADDILSTMMDEGDEGIYNMEVEQEFISSYDQTDYMRIGIDNQKPIIYRIIPSFGYYSGKLLVQVNASDASSGVRSVWVGLINKDTSATYLGEANATTTGYFEIEFDTIALGVADGTYNITVNVSDNAGNVVEATVDPAIDNTPPSISVLSVPASMCVGATNVLTVIVTDLLSGVCAKNATLTLPNDSVVDLLFDGDNLYYIPDANLSGFYNLTITASDCAITPNNMTNVSEHNITVEECPVIPPVEVAGGGGGGSGCLTSWDCSGWSECANGKQSRTCAKEESGCNAGAKPVETMSCAMEEAEPLFSPEEVPAPTSNILLIVIWSIIGAGVIGGIIWYIIYKKKKKAATSLAAYNIQ
jgi:hypothetical protein